MFIAQSHHVEMIQSEMFDFMRLLQIGERDLAMLLDVPEYVVMSILEGYSYPSEDILRRFWRLKDEYQQGRQ